MALKKNNSKTIPIVDECKNILTTKKILNADIDFIYEIPEAKFVFPENSIIFKIIPEIYKKIGADIKNIPNIITNKNNDFELSLLSCAINKLDKQDQYILKYKLKIKNHMKQYIVHYYVNYNQNINFFLKPFIDNIFLKYNLYKLPPYYIFQDKKNKINIALYDNYSLFIPFLELYNSKKINRGEYNHYRYKLDKMNKKFAKYLQKEEIEKHVAKQFRRTSIFEVFSLNNLYKDPITQMYIYIF